MLIGILGPLTIEGGDGPVALGGTKRRLLLTLLAASSPHAVGVDRIADVLWDGAPPPAANTTVQTYVYQLRKLLGADAVVTTPAGYAIAGCDIDARRFERLLRSAGEETRDERRGRLADAAQVWRGTPFEEFSGVPSLAAERTRLVELHLGAIAARIDADLAAGDHALVVAELEALVAEHPLRERFWAQLMIALYRSDRQADSLRAIERLRRQLRDELGINPGPALVTLEQQILGHDPALRLLEPTGTSDSPLPTGAHESPEGRRAAVLEIDDVFVGRQGEVEHVLGRVRRLRSDRPGGVVMLVGEAGIGKTATARRIARAARAEGVTVLWGRSLDGSWATPYGAVMDAVGSHLREWSVDDVPASQLPVYEELRALLPSAGTADGVDAPPREESEARDAQLRTLVTLSRFITGLSSTRPVVLVLDDLHWADSDTLVALRHLGRETARLPMLVLGTYRDDEVRPDHPLRALLGALPRECDVERVRLRGLTPDDVAAIAGAVTGAEISPADAERIARVTSGNPFFVHQVIRQPDDGLPATVIDVVEFRLGRLPSSTQRLLRAGCVFGGDFSFPVAVAVAGLDDHDALDALDGALDAHLLITGDRPDTYRFVHVLARDAIASGLNPSRRLRLHRRAAELLLASTSSAELTADVAGEIAGHFHRSRSLPGAEQGVPAALVAADHATVVGAHDDAVQLNRLALELVPAGHDERPELLGRLGLALARAARADEATATIAEAVEAIASTHGDARAADYVAEAWRAGVAGLAGLEAHLITRGVELAGDRRDLTWAYLYVLWSEVVAFDEIVDDALFGLASEMIMADTGNPGLTCVLSPTHPTREHVLTLDEWPSARLFGAGDLRSTVGQFHDTAAELKRAGWMLSWAKQRAYESMAETGLGNLDRAQAILDELAATELPFTTSSEVRNRLLVAAYLLWSARDDGWDTVTRFVYAEYPGQAGVNPGLNAAVAKFHARRGEADEAAASLETAASLLDPRIRVGQMDDCLTVHDIVEVLWYTGSTRHLALAGEHVDRRLARDLRGPMSDMRLSKARLCALAGDRVEAARWFADSRAALEETGARPLRAIVDLDEALMHVRRPDDDRSLSARLLAAATEQFSDLGMTGWVRRANTLGGERPHPKRSLTQHRPC